MPELEGAIARKLLPIIYVLDTSGSMSGAPIAAVNQAMKETIPVLEDVSATNPDAELKIGVLQFASGAQWVNQDLVYLEGFYWNDLTAGGLTDLGAALDELDDKMSRKALFNSAEGYKLPVLIFMSDGVPTDDWESALTRVTNHNKWFRHAIKIAMAVGDGADKEVLAKVVGNPEAVISVDNLEGLKKLIRVVSATASKIGSKSKTDDDSQHSVIDGVKSEIGDDSGVSFGEPSGDSGSGTGGSNPDPTGPWDSTIWD